MMKNKYCEECGAEIVLQYVTPNKSFRIKDGEIIRDDAWTGAGYDDSYVYFRCSNDSEHDISMTIEMDKWMEDIKYEFKRQNLFAT